MGIDSSIYFSKLKSGKSGNLTYSTIKAIFKILKSHMKDLQPISSEFPGIGKSNPRLSQDITKLELRILTGNPSWEGLVAGFPTTAKDLSTRNVSTPYLRMLLPQIRELYDRIKKRKD